MNTIAQSTPSVLDMIKDLNSFVRIPKKAQADILTKLDCVQRLQKAHHKQTSNMVSAMASSLRVSESSIYRYVTQFNKSGWSGLIDHRRFPTLSGRFPKQFKDEIIGLFEDHQRNDDAAEVRRKKLAQLELWRRTGDPDHAIPGYEEPPADDPTHGHPYGWSLKTFQRLKIKGYQRALAKQGPKSAANFLPDVLTTRLGASFLQRVYFDDQDYDNKIAVAGLSASARPVGFNCLDHLTGAHLGYHLRILTKSTDEQTNKALTGKEFTWFALHFLQTIGYRNDEMGTELVFEHGTANSYNTNKTGSLTTFSGHHSFEEALAACTGNKVTVNRSGKFNQPAFAGMLYPPSSTGNFRFKTWIESAFRLVRTYMQALPGPIGSHQRINGKDELYGIELEEKRMLKAMQKLPPVIADKMKHELLTYVEFADILRAVYRAINARTDHTLEAWEECGFTRALWRLSEVSNHWMPRSELESIEDPDERAYLLKKVTTNRNLLKDEQLSPTEAAQRACKDPAIITLGRQYTPLLIPKEWAVEKTVNSKRTIKIQDPFHKKTKHQYITQLETPNGLLTIPPGTDILCYHNPFDIDNLVICSTDGSYLGTLTRTIPRQVHDQEATLLQLEERARLKADLDAAPRSRAATIMEERQRTRSDNDRIRSGDFSTPAERRSAAAHNAVTTRRTNAADDATDGEISAILTPDDTTPNTEPEFDAAQALNDLLD